MFWGKTAWELGSFPSMVCVLVLAEFCALVNWSVCETNLNQLRPRCPASLGWGFFQQCLKIVGETHVVIPYTLH